MPVVSVSPDGWARLRLPKDSCPSKIHLEWGKPGGPRGSYDFAQDVVVECGEENDLARLNNLAYSVDLGDDTNAAISQFQTDYQVGESGTQADGSLPPLTKQKLAQIYGDDCDASRQATGDASGDGRAA
jgi:hypothetical protein